MGQVDDIKSVSDPLREANPKPVEIQTDDTLPAVSPETLPRPMPVRHKLRSPHRVLWLMLGIVLVATGASAYWWYRQRPSLPAGIVSSNGRLEAEEIDIDTKFAGRVLERLVDEGDLVQAGQVVARMDARELQATLKSLEAQIQQARRTLDESKANVTQQTTQVTLAQQELDRTTALIKRGFATHELLDQRQQVLAGAEAALTAAKERVGGAEHALESAVHNADVYKINIADNTLVAPTLGRIQYRIANVGEVLPVGGKVFTMLDISNVYMDIYLPTAAAGRLKVGSEARIVLDAWPSYKIPAHVSFVATQAQFTPKAVETQDERDKLMFRVKVRVDRGLLLAHAADIRIGLPGRAYVRLDPKIAWPKALNGMPVK